MRYALKETYDAVPSPKIVIAVGACAISGGPYIDHPEQHNGADAVVPVDLYIPGCPPHPLTILHGLLSLLGRLSILLQSRRASAMKRYSPSYSITMRLRYPDRPGHLGRITSAIGEVDGLIGAVDVINIEKNVITRDITVSTSDVEHGEQIVGRVRLVEGVEVVHVTDRTFQLHLGGKIEVRPKLPVKTRDDLSMVYTPGVARVCEAIRVEPRCSVLAHDSSQHRGRHHGRLRRFGDGQYRSQGGAASDGRQGASVQGIRRCGRLSDLSRYTGR